MKFLVDNQLPLALAKFLISKGHHATHVLELGLASARDSEIWNWRGNCRTADLLSAFESVLPQIEEALHTNQLVEMR